MSARITAENAALFAKADALDGLAKACMSFGSDELSGDAYTALAAYYADCIAPYLSSVRTVVLEKAALNTSYPTHPTSPRSAAFPLRNMTTRTSLPGSPPCSRR